MMWQEIIVGICVLAALAFILRGYLLPIQKKNTSTCAGCTGCGSKQEKYQ